MGTEIAKWTKQGKAIWNIVKGIGPYALSLSDTVSESYAEHQLRLAKVDVFKKFMVNEAKCLTDTKNKLMQKYYASEPVERIRIKIDIEEINKETRKLCIYQKASSHLAINDTSNASEGHKPNSISSHWLDKFNQLAEARNEPWREDLLAKALASEAEEPGTIGPQALWMIGTMDECVFHALAAIIDTSSNMCGTLMIPNALSYNDRFLPFSSYSLLQRPNLGAILLMQDCNGLVANSEISFQRPGTYICQYGHRKVSIGSATEIVRITGYALTELGNKIAPLYQPHPNLLGQEIFEKWLASLDTSKFTVTEYDY